MRTLLAVMSVVGLASGPGIVSHVPSNYRGKPYEDSVYKSGAQVIPGRVQCAYFDLGGEGVAYHDEDAINHGSGELNRNPRHQRPHATAYVWQFREKEGVDLSFASFLWPPEACISGTKPRSGRSRLPALGYIC